jgi:hypothetical protein
MDKSTSQDCGSPGCAPLRPPRGEAVAPLAALTGRPMALARRSPPTATGASPLGSRSNRPLPATIAPPIGGPEALSAGELEGAEPPPRGGAAPPPRAPSSAPLDLDTQIGATRRLEESGTLSHLPAVQHALPFQIQRLTLDEYRTQAAAGLRRHALFHVAHGKRRRNFVRKASHLLECGQRVLFRRCEGCAAPDTGSARVLTRCDLRLCPSCSRRKVEKFRDRVTALFEHGERPRRMSLYAITFTLKYDPTSEDDLSIQGLKRRKTVILDSVRHVWRRYLRSRGRAMAFAVEVSPRGAVHVHALYHGRRPDARQLDMLYACRSGGSHLHIDYVKKPRKAICEIAKYMVKAASPRNLRILAGAVGEFIDPELAARAEVAFSGDRLVECLGTWRGAGSEEDEPAVALAPHSCRHCGSAAFRLDVLPLAAWLAHAGDQWRPRFVRAGPDPSRNYLPPQKPVDGPPAAKG